MGVSENKQRVFQIIVFMLSFWKFSFVLSD